MKLIKAMKKKLILLLGVAGSICWLGTILAFDKIQHAELRYPARTIYTLDLSEMRDAALLWMKSKDLSTNGSVSAYPSDDGYWGDQKKRGMTIIVDSP